MNGVLLTLRALHHGERRLARDLVAAAERHHAEPEVRHVAVDLAGWSDTHVRRLAETADRYGLDLDAPPDDPPEGVFATARGEASPAPARPVEPGLLLLRDLRDLHLAATENSLHWTMLAQAAQASREDALLGLASSCHPSTLRQIRWTTTLLKTLSPQLLTTP